MMYFIDTHCHCLPEVDDGAKDMEESLNMLEQAYEDGIRQVIVTPHFHHHRGHASKEVILKKVEELREAVQQRFQGLEIYSGNELHYSSNLSELIADKEVCTLADSGYVLIEFSTGTDYVKMRNALLEVQALGVLPIVAHVERYQCLVEKPTLAEELAEMGAYLQVNADSILGRNGRKEKHMIKKLFSRGYISFVATDAHDTKHRKQQLSECADYVRKKFGEDVVEKCFFRNPQAVIKNTVI